MNTKIFSIDERTDFAQKVVAEYNKHQDAGDFHHVDFLMKGDVQIDKFSDGELSVNFKEYLRGQKVFLVCSTNNSDNMIKLMLAADAARRASAEEIIAVMPYFGYARQDRKDGLRGAVGAKVMTNTLVANGISRIICIDLHADQIQGFVDIPIDHVSGWNIFYPEIINLINAEKVPNLTLCSPDAGGVKRVNKFFKKLIKAGHENTTMAMFSKMRDKPNSVARLDLIGDVKGRDVIIIDDMIDTGGTLCGTADYIRTEGANSVRAICTHGILSGKAMEKITASSLTELIISDTLKPKKLVNNCGKIRPVSCATQIARMIYAVSNKVSADELKNNY